MISQAQPANKREIKYVGKKGFTERNCKEITAHISSPEGRSIIIVSIQIISPHLVHMYLKIITQRPRRDELVEIRAIVGIGIKKNATYERIMLSRI